MQSTLMNMDVSPKVLALARDLFEDFDLTRSRALSRMQAAAGVIYAKLKLFTK